MAEYINYGDQQIDLLALLTAMADNVLSYVNSQTWSNKRKEKFLNAYLDMLSGGIKGASIENGTWGINIGKNIDLNTKSKKDREMYQEAAYFIQNLMKNLLPKPEENKPEEEKKKEVFDFNKHFEQALLNSFGGSKETFKDNWSSLDSVQNNGLFSRTGRATKIKQALESLLSIKEEDYNFEKSSYGNHLNFTDKLNTAITALDNPDTAKEALLSLGVNYKDLLDDYADQKIPLSDGTEITRAEYAALKAKQLEEELAKAAKKTELIKQGNRGVVTLTSGIHGIDVRTQPEAYSQYLAKTYGVGQQGFNRINQEILRLLNKAYNNGGGNGLTAEEKRKLGNFLFYIRANNPNSKAGNWNITPQEWELLKWSKYAKSQNQNDYIRLPWQTLDGRYIFADNQGNIFFVKTSDHLKFNFNRSQTYNNYKNNFLLNKNQIENILNQKLRNKEALRTEINSNDVLYLSSLIPDITSLFDEEPISAGILGVTAAGIRNAALANRPGGMSTEDKLWQALDYAGGALSSIPFFGDAYMLGRILNTARKGATTLLGMAGVVGVSKDIYNLIEKFNNDETLTAKEKIALASSIPLIINAYRSGRAWKQNKTIKAINEGEKIKQGTINATNGSIKGIKKETALKLLKEFKKAGNDNSKKQEILKNNEEVVKLAKELNVKIEDLLFESHVRNFEKTPNILKKLYDIEIKDVPTGNSIYRQNYKKYLEELESGNFWQRNRARGLREADWFYNATGGSRNNVNENNWFKRLWNSTFGKNETYNRIINGNNSTTSTLQPKSISAEETPKINRERINELREKFGRNKPEQSNPRLEYNLKQQHKAEKEIDLFLKSYGEGNNSSISPFVGGYGSSKNKIKPGEYSFDLGNGLKVSFKITKEDLTKKSIELLRNEILKLFKNQVINKTDLITTGNILRKLKKQGFLKQGGTIDKLRILKYKEYIKK